MINTKIIIFGEGQSNMVGNQQWTDYDDRYKISMKARSFMYNENRVFQAGKSNNEDTFSTASDQAGPELSLIYELTELYDLNHTDVILGKMAIGGSQLAQSGGVTDWSDSSTDEYNDISNDRHLVQLSYEIKKDQKMNRTPFYQVVLKWHQGEEDANNSTNASNYGTNIDSYITSKETVINSIFTQLGIPTSQYSITWFFLELNYQGINFPNDVREGVRDVLSQKTNVFLIPSEHLEPDDPNSVHYTVKGYTQMGIEHAKRQFNHFNQTEIPEYPFIIYLGDQDCRGVEDLVNFDSKYTDNAPKGYIYQESMRKFIYNRSGVNVGDSSTKGGAEMSMIVRLTELFFLVWMYKRGVNNATSISYTPGNSNYNFNLNRYNDTLRLAASFGYRPKIFVVLMLGKNDMGGTANVYQSSLQSIINQLTIDLNQDLTDLVDRNYSGFNFIIPKERFDINGEQDNINGQIDSLVTANSNVYTLDTSGLAISGNEYTAQGYTDLGLSIANKIYEIW